MLAAALGVGCADIEEERPLVLSTGDARLTITLDPFGLSIWPITSSGWRMAYCLGPSLYVSPVVKRGATEKVTYLPAVLRTSG